jgi:protocatechuate 3,4-dioxygenase beta subunit
MENFTLKVLSRLDCKGDRTNLILTKLITHLHDFIRDVKPTEEEFFRAIDFLTRTGQTCTDKRQEFLLLSDILGVSMLVDAINHTNNDRVTESTVKGPFHTKAKMMEHGDNIANGPEAESGEQVVIYGQVTDANGKPIENAFVDVWQSNESGFYDVQDANQPEKNLRGIFKTDTSGKFWFKTIKPAPYPVPTDGPVGEILRAMGRHPMRPAHIHFMISEVGHEQLVTHLFVKDDPYLNSDAVFGVKDSLIVDFIPDYSKEKANALSFRVPFYEITYNFKLKRKISPATN